MHVEQFYIIQDCHQNVTLCSTFRQFIGTNMLEVFLHLVHTMQICGDMDVGGDGGRMRIVVA